ncbi:hypothetical protein BKA69DRAFT_201407 [Paraphysoderma sedebokerense]|nr:hypothetical protein BKA69DRAFT_201407 [Paraphysoderma sedebokerense]
MNISQNFTKIFFSVLINFAASEAIAYLIVHILVYFGLTYQVLKRNPTRIAWIPIWKACGFLVPAWTAIVRLIAQVVGGTQLPEDRDRIAWVWAASLAGGWFILVVATALVHKKRYSTKIFMPKPNNKKKDRLSKMISLFKAKYVFMQSSISLLSQVDNES